MSNQPIERRLISGAEKKKALERAFYYLGVQQPFYGGLLQELNISYTNAVPTAAMMFDPKDEQFKIILNPHFFIDHLTDDLRVAILHHEILHFTSKHMFKLDWQKATPEERFVMNIAGDAAINQYLNLGKMGCPNCPHKDEQSYIDSKCPGHWVDINEFKMDDGSPFPKYKDLEVYYELLQSEKKKQEENEKSGKGTKGNVPEKLKGFSEGRGRDIHDWEELDEATKQKMIDEAKKVLRRSIEKSAYSHSIVPDSVTEFLKELEVMSAAINHKRILQQAIKRNVSFTDREGTWNRPSKRFGIYAPGTKAGSLPKLTMYHDFSGSISVTEQNTYLRIMDDFLRAGVRKCDLVLWHTQVFYDKPYRKGHSLNEEDMQSGGTDVGCVMEHIKKHKPNLSIVFTDGYYDKSDVNVKGNEILFIISSGGNQDHPMKHVGKTILLDMLK